ncbi:MAG: hypothetical protein JW863_00655 [Chitinispirillaceae bacterium]|nr:hypothetical protein [Chitinispirillaceae bacterium]
MFIISNTELKLSIIDPNADKVLLGSRYCTGGYIWQIEDTENGPLLTGPQYPSATPLPFHGQGAPEAFVTPLGNDDVPVGEIVTVIGVGEVLRTSGNRPFHVRDNPTVRRFCTWTVKQDNETIIMTTDQISGEYALTLTRRVSLDGRTVTSYTEVINQSSVTLSLSWFPHPFFPPSSDGRCCRFVADWSVPENNGYYRDNQGCLRMKREYPWKKGLFQQLEISSGEKLAAEVQHHAVGSVSVSTDYQLAALPVWANAVTFSPEPYLYRVIAAGEVCGWKIFYRF